MNNIVDRLKPSSNEIERLALRETDPALYDNFHPFERGPLFAIGAIGIAVILGAITAPWRLLFRRRR